MVGARLVSAAMLVVGLTLMLTAPCVAEESVGSSSLLNKKHHSHHRGGAFLPANTSSKKKTIHKVESRIAAVTKELEERIFLAADSPQDLARSHYGVQVEEIIASAPDDVTATKFWVHCRSTTIKLAKIFGGKHCGMVIKLDFTVGNYFGDGARDARVKTAKGRVKVSVKNSCDAGPRRGREFAEAAEVKRRDYCTNGGDGTLAGGDDNFCVDGVDWRNICTVGDDDDGVDAAKDREHYATMEAKAQTPAEPYLLFVDLGYAGVFYGKFVGGKDGALGHITGYDAPENSGIMDTLVRRVKEKNIDAHGRGGLGNLSDYKRDHEGRIYDIIDKPDGFGVPGRISERDILRFILRYNAMRKFYSVAHCNCLLLVAALHQYLTTGNAAQLAIGDTSKAAIEPPLNSFVSFIRGIMSRLSRCESHLDRENVDEDDTLDGANIRGWR